MQHRASHQAQHHIPFPKVNHHDSDGIIDQLRITKGVEAAVFLYPIKDGYKVSMRSNETVNVSEIAKSHGGGGHIRAAGCSVKGNLQDVKNMIINDITKQL